MGNHNVSRGEQSTYQKSDPNPPKVRATGKVTDAESAKYTPKHAKGDHAK